MMRHGLHSQTSWVLPPGKFAQRANVIFIPQFGQVFRMTFTVRSAPFWGSAKAHTPHHVF